VREGEEVRPRVVRREPYPFGNAAELLQQAELNGLTIWQHVLESERATRSGNPWIRQPDLGDDAPVRPSWTAHRGHSSGRP
jgi:hypothetical protein